MFETDVLPVSQTASRSIIGACIEVHRHLGPGLLESAYEAQLLTYLRVTGIETGCSSISMYPRCAKAGSDG